MRHARAARYCLRAVAAQFDKVTLAGQIRLQPVQGFPSTPNSISSRLSKVSWLMAMKAAEMCKLMRVVSYLDRATSNRSLIWLIAETSISPFRVDMCFLAYQKSQIKKWRRKNRNYHISQLVIEMGPKFQRLYLCFQE